MLEFYEVEILKAIKETITKQLKIKLKKIQISESGALKNCKP